MATTYEIVVEIDEPDGGNVSIPRQTLRVTGTAYEKRLEDGQWDGLPLEVTVVISVSDVEPDQTQTGVTSFDAYFAIPTEGPRRIVASARGNAPPRPAATNVNITFEPEPEPDLEAPQVTITEPPPQPEISGGPLFTVTMKGTATDLPANNPHGISAIQYQVGPSGPWQNVAHRTPPASGHMGHAWSWEQAITVPQAGVYTISVRASDTFDSNRWTDPPASLTVTFQDIRPPEITITSPATDPHIITWVEGGTVEIEGTTTAADFTIEVTAVEWRLDGGVWQAATNDSETEPWSKWRFTMPMPAPGLYDVAVRATNEAGNASTDEVQLDVAVPFELEAVSYAAYLEDLMTFTRQRVRATGHAPPIPIDKPHLTATFYQRFDRLTEPSFRPFAVHPVAQVRIAVEVLRRLLDNYDKDQFPHYYETAYHALLANFGTSYTELRLARKADPETRKALANRLGITLEGFETLFLPPDQMTEARLQTVFGLYDTTQDPFMVAGDQAAILTMQLDTLRSSWLEQDQLHSATNPDFPTPIIDPDIIEEADFKSPVPDNLALLLQERQEWIHDRLAEIQAAHAQNTLAGFDDAVTVVLGNNGITHLLKLEKDYKDGLDIQPDLRKIPLELGAFIVFMRLRALAGDMLPTEWQELDNILVQVKKQREFPQWTEAEQQANITLAPTFFRPRSTLPNLIPWRATWRGRRNWEKTLAARIRQQEALIQAHHAAIEATEAVVLPLLRDALIATIDRQGYPDMDLADWLTQRLSMSFKYSGDQKLSRLDQGVETLQDILLALRTGRLETVATLPVGTTMPKWELAVDENDFDEEWAWMGSYATWRGAMSAFGYPENYLLPTLRDKEHWTSEFKALVKAVRQERQLTPGKAEELAGQYFALTSQLTKTGLRTRRNDSKKELLPYVDPERGGLKPEPAEPDTQSHLNEVYFFVPMLLALSLQEKGHFLAALDWYQTVYAYELPPGERKIYYGLEAEEKLPTEFRRTIGWLLEKNGLDVFSIANDRANAMTRFTLLSIVRCHLAFADAEFTRETNESIPLARRLYITALGFLDLLSIPPPVAHWTFDTAENLGQDMAGNGHQATLHGGQWAANGWRSGAISFSGGNDFAEVPHQPALALGKDGADFSVAFALYLRAPATGQWRVLLRKGPGQDVQQQTPGIWLHPDNNKVLFGVRTTAGNDQSTASKAEVPLKTWTHIACVRQGKLLRLYLNGQFDSEAPLSDAEDAIGFDAPLYIGNDRTHRSTNALFDDVRVFDRALSADAIIALSGIDRFPPNPVVNALRQHAELNLRKLQAGRNIAGMERIRTIPAAVELVVMDGVLTLPPPPPLKPTAYRYAALIERAKHLVTIAQQIEANFFAALEKQYAETYTLFKAKQHVDLTKETLDLQVLRIQEAESGIVLMELQHDRAETQYDTYTEWICAGPNQYERDMLQNYTDLKNKRLSLANYERDLAIAHAAIGVASAAFGKDVPASLAGIEAVYSTMKRADNAKDITRLETDAQSNKFNADLQRRKDEWALQSALAAQDKLITDQQIFQARLHKRIVEGERDIASTQVKQAEAEVAFLNNKFTNVELYEWMSGILSGVYSYFLQQATAMAQLALNQLAFERQERPPTFIRSDYWQAPPDGALQSADEKAPDRQGLTGSARLLQDIYQLDQYAFETTQRKLQLVQHFSLARLVPYELQRFRDTGILPFATPMALFDQGFPGHYLRLIKRVRMSVVGLIPPTDGIRATLSAAGVSRVVTGREVYQVTEVRRPAEIIAFTSPNNATGLFELQPENELLLPFETMGVDAHWELQVPKAANRFNFDTIADVIFTVEYTALHSADYRQQVIRSLDRTFSAERAYSFQHDFPDLWYDLHYPEALLDEESGDIRAQFPIERTHFPPNLQELRLDHIVLYFVRAADAAFEIEVKDLRCDQVPPGEEPRGAMSIDGVISTRRANANSWVPFIGQSPVGTWTVVFANTPDFRRRFEDNQITDILCVVSYSADTPSWPE